MFYSQLKERFSILAKEHSLLGENIAISARILKNEEAIGNPTRQDYPLLKGKEFLMEANFRGCRGQAFTDAPCEKVSTLAGILALPIEKVEHRALFIASLNAVIRFLKPELETVHCHNDEPEECAAEIIRRLQKQPVAKIGQVGLQPAILAKLVETFGADNVICIDRDEHQRGSSKFGVPIKWGGEQETAELFKQSDVVLATGSTVINGSLPTLIKLAEKNTVPLYFYGTSIAGTAELMNLKRFCFQAT
ncbi:Putative heavy-metal chelation [Desulfuromusa kysingii]|uniref:Putative heavy-metal chelation n=1 Tax=Desulfuromusa kysingii TaxID=37625 RepID=A0A1H4A2F7_9BACT|nr:DUF364 domain-containing protein [Desulfuromusa kysingii]SEA29654.1 Putative heavy-metal chelation [Desulfuromusa kysingii]